jgi:Secretion system C-terminal sorting domain
MKKLSIFLIVVFLANKLFAQAYVPFLNVGTTWQFEQQDLGYTGCYTYSIIDSIGKLVNGKKYLAISRSVTSKPPAFFSGYLFDDTLQRKVYAYDSISGTESLLYNFAASVGDTITFKNFISSATIIADTIIIDSIITKMVNATARKFFYYKRIPKLGSWSGSGYYVEGIGSSNDLFAPDYMHFVTDPFVQLRYMKVNNTVIYPDTLNGYYKCIPQAIAINSLNKNNNYYVAPNPSQTGLFYLNVTPTTQWQVFNMQGQLITTGKASTINLKSNNDGMYLLKIIADNNVTTIIKLIKE